MTGTSQRNNKSQDIEAQPQGEGVRRKRAHQRNILMSGCEVEASGVAGSSALVGEAGHETQGGSSTRSRAQPLKCGPGESAQPGNDRTPGDAAPELPRIIGDFDDNANALLSLHVEEAMSHDNAHIQSLKDHMDGVLIFAGLFSAALTSFLVDKIHDLQVDPAQQMVYYQQQNVVLLAQISKQVSSIAPQVSIPSIPPPPYVFTLNPSDVRVNVFWFMSLVFSISVALLATLVQQWVRDYMHVFQRYSSPLKTVRLRQYLYEGVEGWYMPVVAESVPGLVHVSLFLFFLGLGDSLLNVNTTVGVTTIVPITICGLLYVFSMFAPVIKPQSPFRNPFSGLIWYLKQKVHPRSYYSDSENGRSPKAVSSKISEGQMQLAMQGNDERKNRDVRAIQWLIDNRTEDDEMDTFVMAIPGAFTSDWGIDVWRRASQAKQYQDGSLAPTDPGPTVRSPSGADLHIPPRHSSPHSYRTCSPLSFLHRLGRIFRIRIANDTTRDVTGTRYMPRPPDNGQAPNDPYEHRNPPIYELRERVRRLVGTCNNRSIFTNDELWRKRARGCVETTASLVLCAGVELERFGDIWKLLPPLHEFTADMWRDRTTPGSDGLLVTRLACLSFVIVNREMANHDEIKQVVRVAIDGLSRFGMEDDNEETNNGDDDENALRNAQRIDNDFETAKRFCVKELPTAFGHSEAEMTEERVRKVLERDHKSDISELERIALATDRIANIDEAISRINDSARAFTGGLILHLRGAYFDTFEHSQLIPGQFFNPTESPNFLPQFVFLHQRLRLLGSYSSKLRDIIDGRGNGVYKETLESLGILWRESDPRRKPSVIHRRHLMKRQLWRLQDLRDGSGFGFWVELFFLMARQLAAMSSSRDAHSPLIVGTFRTITSDWRQRKRSIGTQRVILNVVCDIAIFGRGLLSDTSLPSYITDELLELLKNMVEGESGSHIDDAMKELENAINEQGAIQGRAAIRRFREDAFEVISRPRAPGPTS